MSAEHIVIQDEDDGIRSVILRRPEARNALTQAAKLRFCEVMSDSERNPGIRCVVITGTDPAFSAGVDFKEVSSSSASGGPPRIPYESQFTVNPGRALRAMTTPTIAAVNGPCVSGALEIALSCSFIVASELAAFADMHARLGVVATWGLTALLPQAVGVRRAREMSITGRRVGASEALDWGMVNHVVPHSELMSFVRKLAREVTPLATVGELLALYARGEGMSLSQQLELEAQHTSHRSFDAEDFARRRSDIVNPPQESD